MKYILSLTLALSFSAAFCQTLTLKWKSDATLLVSESVAFDSKNNVLYVSCIDGKPEEKDGKGYIGKVSPDGKVIAAQWVSGLDAPKGLGIFKDNLYVADVTKIVTINIPTGKITSSVEVPGSKFLNDIAVDSKGNVYASDTQTGKIHVLKDGKVDVFFESAEFKGVNGVLCVGNDFYIVDFATGTFYKLTADKKLSVVGKTAEGADGIVPIGNNEYLVSSWHGEVYLVNAKGESKKLIDTKEEKINAADIEYDAKTKTLYVPTFFANGVSAYTLSK
ncbi:MAG TPA: ATP/GTP-binding protein [Chryseolinea sp.]